MGTKLKDILAKVSEDATYPAFYRTTDEFHHSVRMRMTVGADQVLMMDEAVQKGTLGIRSREDYMRQGGVYVAVVAAFFDPDPILGAHHRNCRKAHITIRRMEAQHQTNAWLKDLEKFMSSTQTTENQKFAGIAELCYQFKQESEEDPLSGEMNIKALQDRYPQYMPAGFSFKRRI
jgi:hypothetical protein